MKCLQCIGNYLASEDTWWCFTYSI